MKHIVVFKSQNLNISTIQIQINPVSPQRLLNLIKSDGFVRLTKNVLFFNESIDYPR